MPFNLDEIRELASTLRDVCVGLVALAYPDSRPSTGFNFSKQRSSTASQGEDTRLWMHLFKVDTHTPTLTFTFRLSKLFTVIKPLISFCSS